MKPCFKIFYCIFLVITAIHAADDTNAFLQQISKEVDPNKAQVEIRWRVQGNSDACYALFKEAVTADNVRAQLHCTNAYYAMRENHDDQKDFAQITRANLEAHHFAPHVALLLPVMYVDYEGNSEQRAYTTIQRAATLGCPLARLVDLRMRSHGTHNFLYAYNIYKEFARWNESHFLFPEAAYEYGEALLNAHNRQFSLEGLKHMAASGFLKVYSEDKKIDTILEMDSTNNRRYGMQFSIHNEILAPSLEYWQQFKREYLDTLPVVSKPFFKLFEQHDIPKVAAILRRLNISTRTAYDKLGGEPRESIHLSSSEWNYFGTITRETFGGMIKTVYISKAEKEEFAPALSFLTAAYIQLQNAEDMRTLIINLKEDRS